MPGSTDSRRARRRQALVSAAVNAAMQLLSAGVLLWVRDRWFSGSGFWSVATLVLAVADLLLLIPLLLSLRARLHEIEGGEEDEASQY